MGSVVVWFFGAEETDAEDKAVKLLTRSPATGTGSSL